jgi:hypothetical protein
MLVCWIGQQGAWSVSRCTIVAPEISNYPGGETTTNYAFALHREKLHTHCWLHCFTPPNGNLFSLTHLCSLP